MKPDDFKDIELDFSAVRVDREWKAKRYDQWRAGELSADDAAAFADWLIRGIRVSRVTAIEPSFARRVKNFAGAVARHVRTGRRKVSAEVAAERLAICRGGCEMFNSKRVSCRHKKCGCNLKLKTTWADQECPLSKWSKGIGSAN